MLDEMSTKKNKSALELFRRAANVENQEATIENHTTLMSNGDRQPDHRSEQQQMISDFSQKYGLLFTPKNTNQSGEKIMASGNINNTKNNETKNNFARDRFRQAGMKARFARRMEKIVEDRMTVKQIFNRYVQNSTLHGFRYIFMNTFVIRRVLWGLLTCAMATVFLMELRNSVELFYEYPFTTTSTVEYVPSLKFPAISFCNLNGFKSSKLQTQKLKGLYEPWHLPFPNSDATLTYDLDGNELQDILDFSSQDIINLLYGCEWKSRDTARTGRSNHCSSKNFSKYTDLQGNRCYTFNPGYDGHQILRLNETGLNMALKLELDLMTNDSLAVMQDVGLKVVVHDQEDSPLLQAGFIVSPGFQTFVEMKVRKTENLQPPYATKCGAKPLKSYPLYRQSRCFLEQLADEVADKCKCRGPFMPDKDLPLCTLNKTTRCLLPTVQNFDQKTSNACPVDCSSIQYLTSLSYARFLSTQLEETSSKYQKENWIHGLKKRLGSTGLQQYIAKTYAMDVFLIKQQVADLLKIHSIAGVNLIMSENVIVLKFFYQEMKEENVKQEASYDFYKLVGDVGGQLGLMLGASVLTLVEFVDLFFFTIYHQLLRLSRRKQRE